MSTEALPGVLARTTERTGYAVLVASDPAEIRAAQRLRHRVFADELGARLATTVAGVDSDELDAYCDHLLVRDESTGAIVGTYRMLPPGRAPRLYSDGEFDLTALDGLRPSLVEVGRSCVDPEHRNGAVINLMWSGIARYMLLTGHQWLAGCASVPIADGAPVWAHARSRNLAPEEYRVTPHHAFEAPDTAPASRAALPPLLRGYLRLGAWVCGPPALDEDFGCVDFLVLLGMDRIDQRYLRHFLGEA